MWTDDAVMCGWGSNGMRNHERLYKLAYFLTFLCVVLFSMPADLNVCIICVGQINLKVRIVDVKSTLR